MVVDDDEMNNFVCELNIRRINQEADILLFTDPTLALETIQQIGSLPDGDLKTLLFLDLNMPEMSGWEFLDEFKNFISTVHQQFIIYMLSSSLDKKDQEIAELNPFVAGFLSKPLRIETLKEISGNLEFT